MTRTDGFDDDVDVDSGFSQDKDLVKPSRQPYEVEFSVLGPADIQAEQDRQIDEVAAILGLPPEAAAILLRYAKWNKERLIEQYMDNEERVLDAAGLEARPGAGTAGRAAVGTAKIPGFACDICCEDGPDLETYALKCGHRFCVDCYTQYLSSKIRDEGEAARIKCPGNGCDWIVDSKSLSLLVEDRLKSRYSTQALALAPC